MVWDEKIRRRLKLKDLEALIAVKDAGGVGKAASRLNYSQSAVSKSIAGLERALGKRLMERVGRGVDLTPYGEALLRCGIAVVDDLKRGLEEIEFLSDPTVGEVRIGCTEPVAVGLVSSVIDSIIKRYPRMKCHIVPGEPPELYRELDARNVDFVITRFFKPGTHDGRHVEVLYDEPVVVVAGMRHPCARRRQLELSDLADASWVLPPANSFISVLVADNFREFGLAAPTTTIVSTYPTMRLRLVAGGRLLTVVPPIMLQICAKQLSVKALPVKLRNHRRSVGIVTLKNRALSPVAQLFIGHARAVAKTMARG